jgi:general stress protein 26
MAWRASAARASILDRPWYSCGVDPAKLLEFLRFHRLAVQGSVSPLDTPQAAIVGFAVTDRFEIIFDTLQTTRKAQNLRKNPAIALVIGGWAAGDERTVQYEGVADEPSGAELERLKKVYYAVYPDGVSRAAWPGLIYIRVTPKWIRYSDYNKNPPEIVEFKAADLVR